MSTSEAADSCCWYVVRTKPKQELRAASNLRAWGIDVFAPRIRERSPARDGSECAERIVALFPGYIFSRFDYESCCTRIRLTRGVHSIVAFGESATAVDGAIIDALTSRVQDDG